LNKIYLVSPYTDRDYNTPHTSLEYIRFFLMDSGYNAEIVDCAHYGDDTSKVISKLKEEEKPIIGITAYTRDRFNAYDLIKDIRKAIPDSLIVVGGRHFTSLVVETLVKLPDVDIVVRGEGEITFKEICDAVYSNSAFNDVLGISYKQGVRIIHNPDRPLELDLDKFRSFDKMHLPDKERYSLLGPPASKVGRGKPMRFFTIMATRGCPSNCVFCSLKADRVRFRSIDNVLDEIEDKISVTGVRNVMFKDPSLTINKKFVIQLCEKIIERNLDIEWICYSRVDIDTKLLVLMKQAGLIGVEIALESGSPKVLKAIKKRINLEQFEEFCKEAFQLGIVIFTFCLISLPDERKEDVDLTLSFLRKMSRYIYTAGMQATRILPDAAIYQIAKERNLLPENFDWFKPYINKLNSRFSNKYYSTIPMYIEHLTTDDIQNKIFEFDLITKTEFSYFYNLKRALKANLKFSTLKQLSLDDIKRKTYKVILMIKNIMKNREKLKKYQ